MENYNLELDFQPIFSWMEMVISTHFSMEMIWFIIQLKQPFLSGYLGFQEILNLNVFGHFGDRIPLLFTTFWADQLAGTGRY